MSNQNEKISLVEVIDFISKHKALASQWKKEKGFNIKDLASHLLEISDSDVAEMDPQKPIKGCPFSAAELQEVGNEVASGWDAACTGWNINEDSVEFEGNEHGELFVFTLTFKEIENKIKGVEPSFEELEAAAKAISAANAARK